MSERQADDGDEMTPTKHLRASGDDNEPVDGSVDIPADQSGSPAQPGQRSEQKRNLRRLKDLI